MGGEIGNYIILIRITMYIVSDIINNNENPRIMVWEMEEINILFRRFLKSKVKYIKKYIKKLRIFSY